MNVSLNRIPDEPVEDSIEEHRKIMEGAGYNLTGNTILMTQPDIDANNFPGSYQVWLETTASTWVWIDVEGNAVEEACPVMVGQ